MTKAQTLEQAENLDKLRVRGRSMVKVGDLPQTPEPGVCLRCPCCGETFSATRGDYFWQDPETPFRCQCDETPLKLVRVRTRIAPWKEGRS